MALNAPRTLNAPMACRFSGLIHSGRSVVGPQRRQQRRAHHERADPRGRRLDVVDGHHVHAVQSCRVSRRGGAAGRSVPADRVRCRPILRHRLLVADHAALRRGRSTGCRVQRSLPHLVRRSLHRLPRPSRRDLSGIDRERIRHPGGAQRDRLQRAGPVARLVRVEVALRENRIHQLHPGLHVLRSKSGDPAAEQQSAVRGHNVYVVVSTDDWAKRPIPPVLREALTSVERQARNASD